MRSVGRSSHCGREPVSGISFQDRRKSITLRCPAAREPGVTIHGHPLGGATHASLKAPPRPWSLLKNIPVFEAPGN
jgi:hypothetical protein